MGDRGVPTVAGPSPPALRRLAADLAPLSFAQERLWLIDAAAPGSVTYNVPILLPWRGRVEVGALETALTAVVARHEILRTTYELRDGRPVQVVGPAGPVAVEVLDRDGTAGSRERAVEDAARRAREPFDLSHRPPLRCAAWRGIPGGDLVLLVVHHIAIDGWSLGTFFADLARAYEAAVAGARPDLPELPFQYTDYAAWDREAFAAPAGRRQLSERVAELLEVPRDLALAGWRPAPAIPQGARRGDERRFRLPERAWSGIQRLARRLRVTPFVVLLAAFQVALQRWSGRDEFLVGAIAANRPLSQLEDLVGFFVNTVPLRCRLRPDWSFSDLCTEARTEAFRSLSLQRVPFDQLTAAVGSPDPLVQVGFALQNVPARALAGWPRWEAPRFLPTGTAKFDLLLTVEDGEAGPAGTLEWDVDRYPADLGPRLAETFLVLLDAVAADAARPLRHLPVRRRTPGGRPPGVVEGERRDLVAEWLRRLGA
jgi:hypothetical protein